MEYNITIFAALEKAEQWVYTMSKSAWTIKSFSQTIEQFWLVIMEKPQ